jgi:hypothetical protein
MQSMSGFLASAVSRPARAINTAVPWLKELLPKPLRRYVLLHVVGVQRSYPDVSRKMLEAEILPSVAACYSKVLFVGTSSYSYWYERLFRRDQYATIDGDPTQAVWGAADHIVAPVQEIGRHRPPGSFDCVVLNGVFGFGTDDAEAMRAVAVALHGVLRPAGRLVLGWNSDKQEDPETLATFDGLFVQADEPRRTFPGETHVYDFYRRQ